MGYRDRDRDRGRENNRGLRGFIYSDPHFQNTLISYSTTHSVSKTFFCLPACPVVCLSVSLFLSFFLFSLPVCVSDSLSLSLLVRLCQSVSLCFNMFIYLARYLDISIIRCIHLSIILSWYLFISPLALFLHKTLPNNVLLL